MKTFNHCTILVSLIVITVLALFLTSCSAEPDEDFVTVSEEPVQKITGAYPENAANIYDAAGQLHNEISESFLTAGLIASTTTGTITQVEALAFPNTEFQALKPSSYISPTAAEVDLLIDSNEGNVLDVIANSTMTTASKLSLRTFMNSLMLQYKQEVDFDSIHKFILDYEDVIIYDNTLPASDSKVILTTTSIARHGFYLAKKRRRKPRDWDWSISWGNLTAGTYGSNESVAKAIIVSATCGLLSNKNF